MIELALEELLRGFGAEAREERREGTRVIRVLAPPGTVWCCGGTHEFTLVWMLGDIDGRVDAYAGMVRALAAGTRACEDLRCRVCPRANLFRLSPRERAILRTLARPRACCAADLGRLVEYRLVEFRHETRAGATHYGLTPAGRAVLRVLDSPADSSKVTGPAGR